MKDKGITVIRLLWLSHELSNLNEGKFIFNKTINYKQVFILPIMLGTLTTYN